MKKGRQDSKGKTGVKAIVFFKCLLLAALALSLAGTSAYSLEFITEDQFITEESVYKDYPLKVLFQKLAASDDTDRRAIRNYIILKQVFDETPEQGSSGGVLEFQEISGIIKAVSGDTLTLWVPQAGVNKDYYVGIDRIPLDADKGYDISVSGIGRYVMTLYTLDKRVYKIKVSFPLEVPTGLSITRKSKDNVVEWKEPGTSVRPVSYRVFVNDRFYKAVEGTSIPVPRTDGKVDAYHVKAVYQKDKSLFNSAPSEIINDQTTAKEVQEEVLASETYDRVISLINPGEWEKAKTILYENNQLLVDNLKGEAGETGQNLTRFFRDVDEGDRLSRGSSGTITDLEVALSFYRRAEAKIDIVPASIDIQFIIDLKIHENERRIAFLENRNKNIAVQDIYNNVLVLLNPGEWAAGRELLHENRETFTKYLDEESREISEKLIRFFQDIVEGDRLINEERETVQKYESALGFYRRAETKAKDLPKDIDMFFLTDLRIRESEGRIALLETKNRELLAQDRYQRIISALDQGDWERSRNLLYESSQIISEHLSQDLKDTSENLVRFFRDIDEGDRFARKNPESMEGHETALKFFERAEETARELPLNIDVQSIIEQKVDNSREGIALLENLNKNAVARETYGRVLTLLNPGEWYAAKELLYENREIFLTYLEGESKETSENLVRFFQDIVEGDRLKNEIPDSISSHKTALRFYKRADEKAKGLPGDIDMSFLSELKIHESVEAISHLERKSSELAALDLYERILASLNPGEWEIARELLYDNREYLAQHLNKEHTDISDRLAKLIRDIDEGDRLKSEGRETVTRYESALGFYRRAKEKAKDLPENIDMFFLTDLRIRESEERIALLETKNKELLAQNRYLRVLSALDQGDWETARSLLYESRHIISDHLPQDITDTTEVLIRFFKDVDEGDRLSREKPESIEGYEAALGFFKKAEETARELPLSISVQPVIEPKINKSRERIALLEINKRHNQAQETYDRIIAGLNPGEWETSRDQLYASREFLSDYLKGETKSTSESLIRFFRDMDEGDRLKGERPETVKNHESALSFYRRAADKGKNLDEGEDVMFLIHHRIQESEDRIALLETKNRELITLDTYNRIIASLNHEEWEASRDLLYENKNLLADYLDQGRNDTVMGLIGFYKDIDAGDRLKEANSEAIKAYKDALTYYRSALNMANELPVEVDVTALASQRINDSENRISLLETRDNKRIAEDIYNNIVGMLNPGEWEKARKQLFDNRTLLSDNLEEAARIATDKLIRFFQDIDEGDRLMGAMPETLKGLETALVFFRSAEARAEDLPENVDVLFLMNLRIYECDGRIARLEILNRQLQAEKVFDRIVAALNPGEWEAARKLLYESSEYLSSNLKPDQKEIYGKLTRFFRDIDEGDRLNGDSPDTAADYENILSFYNHAQDQIRSLPSGVDAAFISETRIAKVQGELDRLRTKGQGTVIVRKEHTPQEISEKTSLEKALGKVPEGESYDSNREMGLALKAFDSKEYDLAMSHIIKGFRQQMEKLSSGGQNQVRGILGVPIACRGEVIYLVELYRLRDKKGNDNSVDIEAGVDEIRSRLENREWLWVIVRDGAKRRKILDHIAGFDPGFL